MFKKFALFALLTLYACNSPHKTFKSPQQSFYDTHLFFDLESEVTRNPCKITGTIPPWLSGTLLRNGPAKFQVGEGRVDWFDGLAMLHAFECSKGEIFYSNRFLRSEQYFIMMNERSLNFNGFAQDPCPKVFKNQTSHFIPKEMKNIKNADVSIQKYANKIVALTEIPLPVVFHPKTLETLGVFSYQDKLTEGQWESAHPQYDPASEETVNYFIRFGEKSSYVIWKMGDQKGSREVVAEVPVDRPSYMHSFALTEHYVVLVEFPFVVNPLDLLLRDKPFIFNYKWEPTRGTIFTIVNRSTGRIEKIKGDPFFAFHHVNAFDKEGKIYLDIVTYPNAEVIQRVTNQATVGESQQTKLERFTITLEAKELSLETLFDKKIEMPSISSSQRAHEYRYCYVADSTFPTSVSDSLPLYKVDTKTKNAKSWSERGCFPGEPIFVQRPGGKAEDDGVVLSVVLDFANRHSFLLILDGIDFKEIARAKIPHAIPLGLHGLWDSP